ncbi:HD domain-containing phosphohydrolase [Sulfurimonas sp.]
MSFRTKIVALILFVSLVPYILIMVNAGSFLRDKYYINTTKELQTQLSLSVERIEQYLQTIKRDMKFIAHLDIMNDIYSQDIDHRISNLLEKKKKELHLIGNFYLLDKNHTIIASSDMHMIAKKFHQEPFFSVPVHSTFDDKTIATLVLDFSLKNLKKFFTNAEDRYYYIVLNNNKTLYKEKHFNNAIDVKLPLPTKKNITIVLEQNQNKFLTALKHYEYMFLAAFIFGILIITSVALYMINRLIRPILELSSLVAYITQTKDYSKSVQVDTNDEIGKLAKAFNNMLFGIYQAQKENKKLTQEIESTQKEVVFTMGAIGESRSKETGNHVKRVAEYSRLLALFYGLSEKEAEMLKQASPMHDIGKVAIPDAVLNKPGRFNAEERAIMDTHAELGYQMLHHSQRPLLQAAAIVAYEHHEKWDGSGYPRGLQGENIHIYGRITALADVFDALGSDRVYKKAWDDERIFTLFREERAKHFDPKLIDIFFENLEKFLEIRDQFRDT